MKQRLAAVAALAGALAGPAAAASDAAPEAALRLDLNTVAQIEGACRLTFVVENALGADLDSLVLETVIFDAAGMVERLSLFDFQAVPADRMRVRQFDLPGASCEGIGHVLVNAAESCAGAGVGPEACMERLELRSRAGLEVSG